MLTVLVDGIESVTESGQEAFDGLAPVHTALPQLVFVAGI